MKTFLDFFIKNGRFTFVIALMLILGGIMGLLTIQRESRPPVDFASATITTIYPGSSPEEVEERITNKIEDELRGIAGIKDVVSISQAGRSAVAVRLDLDRANTDKVMGEVQRAVQRVEDLPADILTQPEFSYINAKEIPILELAILGPNQDRQRDLWADHIKTALEDVDGIAEVRLSGYREREFQVLLSTKKMDQNYVGINEAFNAVQRRVQNIPAGFTRSKTQRRLVRVTGQIDFAKELEDVVIRTSDANRSVKIKDVARVVDGEEDPSIIAAVNGQPATLITVTKKEAADGITTTRKLFKVLEKLQEELPKSLTLITYNDEASRIEDRLSIVINNALSGLVLVLVILLIFLPGILGIVTSLSLPLAILGTMALLPALGANFNNITMLGLVIAIGMLVDNSIVISENYARLRLEGKPAKNAALEAVYQFWLPLVATVLTTIAAFLPMLVTKGIMGQFIRWIPIVVTAALTMSLLESFILLPARLPWTLRNIKAHPTSSAENHDVNWYERFRRRFEAFMGLCLRHRYIVLLAISAILISSTLLAVFGTRFELFPREEVEYYYARFELPREYSIGSSNEFSEYLAKEIQRTMGPENVKYVVARSGAQRIGLRDPQEKSGEYVGMATIAVPMDKAIVLNPNQMVAKLRTIDKRDAISLSFEIGGNGPPVGKALNVTFRSNNSKALRQMVDDFKSEVGKIDGVADLIDDEIVGATEYKVEPNFEELSYSQLDVQTLGTALRTALQGAIAAELNQDGTDFNLRIRFDENYSESLAAIKNIRILNRAGNLVPITYIARISEVQGPAVRKHYNYVRAITVASDVIPTKITSVALNARAQTIIDNISKDYPMVSYTVGGEQESTKESLASLVSAMILSLVGIFAILVFLFNSFAFPFLILSSIPLGLVGVNLAFYLHGRPLSFLALIGVVGLAGVVVNSAIVLVSYTQDLLAGGLSIDVALARASSDRLRAVLVTSLTTVGGLFPTAYSIGGHDSILVPMTLALAWGLVAGTLLTIIWVPCGYAIILDATSYVMGIFQRAKDETRSIASMTET